MYTYDWKSQTDPGPHVHVLKIDPIMYTSDIKHIQMAMGFPQRRVYISRFLREIKVCVHPD